MKRNKKEDLDFYVVPYCYTRLSKYTRHLFVIMFNQWLTTKDDDGWYYHSIESLVDKSKLSSRNAVVESINEMIALGILEKKRGFNTPNKYRFLVEVLNKFEKDI